MATLRSAAATVLAATLLAVVLPDAAQAQRALLHQGGKHDDHKHGNSHKNGNKSPSVRCIVYVHHRLVSRMPHLSQDSGTSSYRPSARFQLR